MLSVLTVSIISNFQNPLQHLEVIRQHTGVFHLFNTFLTHHSSIRIQISMHIRLIHITSLPKHEYGLLAIFLRQKHTVLSSTCTQLPRKATPACHFLL